MLISQQIRDWFTHRHWELHSYQRSMFKAFKQKLSTLLIVPTGGGKTLASFLPTLQDIHETGHMGLHTLYISPLKALTYDIQRNLLTPIQEMQLNINVDVRTGDTSGYRRQRQRKKPPHILLTTPESLMLLLSYEDAQNFFQTLKVVIIDELHSLVINKRGDLTALALARILRYAPTHLRFGLSATVAYPEQLAAWLSTPDAPAQIIKAKKFQKPVIKLLNTQDIPYCGYSAKYACNDIYQLICEHKITLIFVNTRSQAEFLFREIWNMNTQHLPIAIYHGSLDKNQRLQTTDLIVKQKIRAIVATSALELGIDWAAVDCVIQVGTPKGISRLLQRIGRSNHQFDKASKAFLVPANCFEAIECYAAIEAIKHNKLDGDPIHPGALDVVAQYIMNCACNGPISPDELYAEILKAHPYHELSKASYSELLQFVINGGYVLQHYERYHRLKQTVEGQYEVESAKVRRRHRQNIGTIVEAAKLKVKRINKRGGRILGEIEESFAQQLLAGDTFLFAGEILEFIRIHDMWLEAKRAKTRHPKSPVYSGGAMPLSTYLASQVLQLVNDPTLWKGLPAKVQDWLQLQKIFSTLPSAHHLLVEHFIYKRIYHTVIYSFIGRPANYTLAALIASRMEQNKLRPLSFTASDYGIAISSLKPINEKLISELLSPEIFFQDLEQWLQLSPAIKRAFRKVALITGLTERQLAGQRKSMKQITFSTDLIYDVLKRYEPNHILLTISYQEVERYLLDLDRLKNLLTDVYQHIIFNHLSKPSPLSLSLLFSIKTERLQGSAVEELLTLASLEEEAVKLISEVRHDS